MRIPGIILCLLPALGLMGLLHAGASPLPDDGACDLAARRAAAETAVPEALLRAVARAESGLSRDGRLTPWPWTLNVAGRGHWFATRAEAEQFLLAHLAGEAGNVDVGCFQISHRWHAAGFASPAAMLDPVGNALYAAGFLSDLHARHGTWDAAVAAYHSSRPEAGKGYLLRVAGMLPAVGTLHEGAGEDPGYAHRAGPGDNPATPARQAGAVAGAGSIFPLPVGSGPLIGQGRLARQGAGF